MYVLYSVIMLVFAVGYLDNNLLVIIEQKQNLRQSKSLCGVLYTAKAILDYKVFCLLMSVLLEKCC